MKVNRCVPTWPCMMVLTLCAAAAPADTLTFVAVKDNTLIQDPKGTASNGAGEFFFSGRIGNFGNGRILRGVLAFDLSAIPANATITCATLTLNMLQTVSGDQTHNLHRVLADWGQGASMGGGGSGAPSQRNDATWIHTFYPGQFWANPGGDFVTTSSASQTVGAIGVYSWSSPEMAADVQYWVNYPASNFGWILIGNEATTFSSKKFASRENLDTTIRPQLEVVFTVPTSCPADVTQDGQVNVSDLLAVINAWGPCPEPCPPHCSADIVQNCAVNVSDLLAVINAWGPCP